MKHEVKKKRADKVMGDDGYWSGRVEEGREGALFSPAQSVTVYGYVSSGKRHGKVRVSGNQRYLVPCCA